jgi:plastocyanin
MRARSGPLATLTVATVVLAMGTASAGTTGTSPSPETSPSVSADASPSPDASPSAMPSIPAGSAGVTDPSEAPPAASPSSDDPGGAQDDDGGGETERRTLRKQATSVDVVDDSFVPAQITVDAGTTITWSNSGQNPHTVTADDGSFGSGTLQAGDAFSSAFATAGTFAYHCTIHGGPGGVGMSGVVVVRGTDATGGDDGGGGTTAGTDDLPATGASATSALGAGLLLATVGVVAVLISRRGSPRRLRAGVTPR